jgi:hypothetical protein
MTRPRSTDFFVSIDYDIYDEMDTVFWYYRGVRLTRGGRTVALFDTGDICFDWTLMLIMVRNIRDGFPKNDFVVTSSVAQFLAEVPGYFMVGPITLLEYILPATAEQMANHVHANWVRIDTPVID